MLDPIATISAKWSEIPVGDSAGHCFAIAFLLVFLPLNANAAGRRSQVSIAHDLWGAWEIDPETKSDFERSVLQRGLYYTSSYEPNGNGTTTRYEGGICGHVMSQHVFKWKVEGNVLMTWRTTGETSTDRIISINSKKNVLYSLDYKFVQYRRKVAACPIS